MINIKGTGALKDPQDPRNYKYSEIHGIAKAPLWREKLPQEWKRYGEVRDQFTSSSCVGQTVATLIGIENLREEGKFNQFSARPCYAKNYVGPDGGMYPSEGFKYAAEVGLPFEIQLRSQLIDEMSMRVISDEAESDKIVAKIFRGGSYFQIDPNDINAMCSVLDRNKGLGISMRFDSDLSPDNPTLSLRGRYGHEVTVTDYCIFNGVKGLVYQNSWGKNWGFGGLGFLPLTAVVKGVDTIFYFEDFANKQEANTNSTHIKHTFNKKMKLGDKNIEVGFLQLALASISDNEGVLFPMQVYGPTNYFGGVTRNAVKRYQALRGMKLTGEVDKDTLLVLNKEFS